MPRPAPPEATPATADEPADLIQASSVSVREDPAGLAAQPLPAPFPFVLNLAPFDRTQADLFIHAMIVAAQADGSCDGRERGRIEGTLARVKRRRGGSRLPARRAGTSQAAQRTAAAGAGRADRGAFLCRVSAAGRGSTQPRLVRLSALSGGPSPARMSWWASWNSGSGFLRLILSPALVWCSQHSAFASACTTWAHVWIGGLDVIELAEGRPTHRVDLHSGGVVSGSRGPTLDNLLTI